MSSRRLSILATLALCSGLLCGSSWWLGGGGGGGVGSGDVIGPASSVDRSIPIFSGTGGKTLQDPTQPIVIDSGGDLSVPLDYETRTTFSIDAPSEGSGTGWKMGMAANSRFAGAGITRDDTAGWTFNCLYGGSCNLQSLFRPAMHFSLEGDYAANTIVSPYFEWHQDIWRAEHTFAIDSVSGTFSQDERMLVRAPAGGAVKAFGQIKSYSAPTLDIYWFDQVVVGTDPVDNDVVETESTTTVTGRTGTFSGQYDAGWIYPTNCAGGGGLPYTDATALVSISAASGDNLTFLQTQGLGTALVSGRCIKGSGSGATADLGTVTPIDTALVNGSLTALTLDVSNYLRSGAEYLIDKIKLNVEAALGGTKQLYGLGGGPAYGFKFTVTDFGYREFIGHNHCPYVKVLSNVNQADAGCEPTAIFGGPEITNWNGLDVRQPTTGESFLRHEPKTTAPPSEDCDAPAEVGRTFPRFGSGVAVEDAGVYTCKQTSEGIAWVFRGAEARVASASVAAQSAFGISALAGYCIGRPEWQVCDTSAWFVHALAMLDRKATILSNTCCAFLTAMDSGDSFDLCVAEGDGSTSGASPACIANTSVSFSSADTGGTFVCKTVEPAAAVTATTTDNQLFVKFTNGVDTTPGSETVTAACTVEWSTN